MEKIIIKLGHIEIEKQKFHQHKRTISINNIDINKIAVSNKVSFGKNDFKYFIGYKYAKKMRPSCIFLPKMSAYRRDFDKTKYISFLTLFKMDLFGAAHGWKAKRPTSLKPVAHILQR